MAIMYSPTDPIFFCHHSQIDRIWAIWQDCWGYSAVPKSQITTEIYNDQSNPSFALDTVMLGYNNTPRDMHSILDWGYVYADNGWASSSVFSGTCTGIWNWFFKEDGSLVDTKIADSHPHTESKSHHVKADRKKKLIKVAVTNEEEILSQGSASFQFDTDIPISAAAQQQLAIVNQVFATSLQQTGVFEIALAEAVAAECGLNPNQSPVPVSWIQMNNLQEEALAGSLDNPCIDEGLDSSFLIKKVKKHKPNNTASRHKPKNTTSRHKPKHHKQPLKSKRHTRH